jgi:hypothetical protein
MVELKYEPVPHDHKEFLKNAQKREGFRKAYNDLAENSISSGNVRCLFECVPNFPFDRQRGIR